MNDNNPTDYQNFLSMFDPAKMAEQFQSFIENSPVQGIDTHSLLDMQKKTFETFISANQSAVSSAQLIMGRQAEMFQQVVKDAQTKLNELSESDPSEAVEKNIESVEQSLQQAMENFKEIAEMMQAAYKEVAEKSEKQMQENILELQNVLSKTQ